MNFLKSIPWWLWLLGVAILALAIKLLTIVGSTQQVN